MSFAQEPSLNCLRRSFVIGLLVTLGACGPKAPTVESPAAARTPPPEAVASAADPSAAPEEEAPVKESPPEKELHQMINEASALLTNPDSTVNIQKAMGMLEQVINGNPGAAYAHFNLGVGYQLMEDSERARREYQSAVSIDPELGHAWLYQGVLHEEGQRYEQAASNYRTGIRNNPENMDLRVALIGLLRKQGDLDGAITEAKKALKVNSNSMDVYNNLGLAYLDLEEYALAQFVYQKALTIDGADQNAYIRCNYGWTMYLKGEEGLANFQLQEAVKLDPELVPALIYLSKMYMEDRNYADTIDLLERAAKKAPDNHGVQMNLGVAYRGVGRLEESAKAYETALALIPDNADPHYNLGILYGDYSKEYDKAIESFELYVQSGGPAVAEAEQYLEAITKEMARAEKRRAAMAKREKRDLERAERKRLLDEQTQKDADKPPDPEPTLSEGGAPAPIEEPAPAPSEGEAPAPTEEPVPAPEEPAPAPEEPAPAPEEPAPDWGASPEPAPNPDAEPDPGWGDPADTEPAPEPEPASEDESSEDNPWGDP